jgi:hypothetical protein
MKKNRITTPLEAYCCDLFCVVLISIVLAAGCGWLRVVHVASLIWREGFGTLSRAVLGIKFGAFGGLNDSGGQSKIAMRDVCIRRHGFYPIFDGLLVRLRYNQTVLKRSYASNMGFIRGGARLRALRPFLNLICTSCANQIETRMV